ncbi:MAG TPA: GAF domain-containing sensor histidine kinase [Thermomicrobiales bacterium]|nr:GAF domain-containing sensor histidine kinase [Thermomicrobiales bacterium]
MDDDGGRARGPLDGLVELARRVTGGRRASLLLPAGVMPDELRVAAASGLPDAVATAARVRLGDPVSGLVAQTRQPLLVNDRAPRGGAARGGYHTGSFISVPVPAADGGYGALNVADPVAGDGFGAADLASLETLAEQIAHELAFAGVRQQAERQRALIRGLEGRIIAAQEDERGRLARELHDEAGHALTAAIFQLDLDLMKAPADGEALQATLERTRESLLACAATLHDIAFALRPRILEDLGLSAALRSLTGRAMEAGGFRATFAVAGDERPLGEALELTAFRVAQEALTNTLKHARAHAVTVELTYAPDALRLTIEDDGVGLDASRRAGDARPSLGLRGLRERVAVLSGQAELGPRLGGGTRVTVTLPTEC